MVHGRFMATSCDSLVCSLAFRSTSWAGSVATSRQFVHQLETGAKDPTDEMRDALAAALTVTPAFFSTPAVNPVREEDCHFRRLASAPRGLVAQAVARGTAVEAFVNGLEALVRLPDVNFPEFARPEGSDAIERVAENARLHWGLGLDGPITNMTRVLENAGAVVVQFDDLTDRIDAFVDGPAPADRGSIDCEGRRRSTTL